MCRYVENVSLYMNNNGISLKGLQCLSREREKPVRRQLQVFIVALWIWGTFPLGIIMHPLHKLHYMEFVLVFLDASPPVSYPKLIKRISI
jgi:hypothetical protein